MGFMSEIVTTDGVLGGALRIEGRRIGVHHVATRVLDAGETPEQVVADYDLDLGDIYRALAYYYDQPAEIRTDDEGTDMSAPIGNARRRLEELRRERKQELAQLDEDKYVTPEEPTLVSASYVVLN